MTITRPLKLALNLRLLLFKNTQRLREISLRIQIDRRHGVAHLLYSGGQVDGGGGLAGTAFLDGEGDGRHDKELKKLSVQKKSPEFFQLFQFFLYKSIE